MPYKFEINQDKRGEYRVNFKAPNGQVMFSTEGYSSKSSATNAIESVKKNAAEAVVDDTTAA
jgi:uncharacterized protein YegP (UPF0339 family)